MNLNYNPWKIKFSSSSSLSLSLSPENSGLHLSYFAEFVCCKILDSNSLFVFLKMYFIFYFAAMIYILVWCIECCCVCHQGQICEKADLCLNLNPCVIKYYLILSYLISSVVSVLFPFAVYQSREFQEASLEVEVHRRQKACTKEPQCWQVWRQEQIGDPHLRSVDSQIHLHWSTQHRPVWRKPADHRLRSRRSQGQRLLSRCRLR